MEKEKNSVFTEYKNQIKEALNDLKTKGRRHKQIPNILTVLRLTAPFFIIPAAFSGNIPLAVGLTAGFGLTDLADGFIARHWKLTSELGKNLDAVCDKVFAGTLLIAASFANPILLCNLALEGAIAGINIYKTVKGEEVHSTFVGKAKTWALFSLAGLGLITPLLNMTTPLNALVGVTSAMQALTIASYLFKNDDEPPKGKNNEEKEEKTNNQEDIKTESKEPTKEKVLDKDCVQVSEEQKTNLRELKSLKDYLLSKDSSTQLEKAGIKVMQKSYEPKKAVGGAK